LTIKSISNTKLPAHDGPFGLCARVFDVNSCAASPPAETCVVKTTHHREACKYL